MIRPTLLVHQYEEYEDPGYFPGQFNGGVFHSEEPDRYPLNTNKVKLGMSRGDGGRPAWW